MTKLFTIGFTEKSAEQFFALLLAHGVVRIIDTRINIVSQLAGFAKGKDLEYLARAIGGIGYLHRVDLAPTKDLLRRYRAGTTSWEEYTVEYLGLLEERDAAAGLRAEDLDHACLLCSEHEPDNCHRRLLAEYLQQRIGGLEIVHLVR
jgi:uncharacterized protein (DUF488 family)